MSTPSTVPTSRRGYLSHAELEEYANITITNDTEADDKISQAEEMIDAYVGPQDKFFENKLSGRASASTANTFSLQADQQNVYDVDFFKLCEVEFLGGTGAGQRRKITGQTREGVLTVDLDWVTNPSTDSFYRIYQLGKFPRHCDVTSYSDQPPTTYYKQIPELIKRAVAAQVAYFITMGEAYFTGDKSEKGSESIGDYSYSNMEGSPTLYKMIAPQAKLLLKGIVNRGGTLLV